jgi:hypothetical protein
VTLRLALRCLRALPMASVGLASFCAVPFTYHAQAKPVGVAPAPLGAGQGVARAREAWSTHVQRKSVGLAARQIVPVPRSST